MTLLQAIILGIIEGLTEFLPISSTGHLILAGHVLRVADAEFLKSFEIYIQLGAILAVGFEYFRRVMTDPKIIFRLIAAFIPTALIGFAFYPFIKSKMLGNVNVVLWSLFIGGFAILIFDKLIFPRMNRAGSRPDSLPSVRQSVLIGVFQSIAVIPGVSRAAATIVGGLSLGLSRVKIVEFSFLLAVPTMLAASVLDVAKTPNVITSSNLNLILTGFIVSFITALVAIRMFLAYVRNHDFTPFAVYRILLAVIFWIIY